ncbi:MAG: PQQ-binding-like beta-propeller repeat protein [Pirellulaceae bacterium]
MFHEVLKLPAIRAAQALACSVAILLALNSIQTLVAQEIRHSFVVADSSKNLIAWIDEDGKTRWEQKIGPLHDLHVLQNGNLLFQINWTTVVEVDPRSDKEVFRYDASQLVSDSVKRVEVHAFQRLENNTTMIAVSGAAKLIEVDEVGQIVHQFDFNVPKPHPHTDTRLVRKLPSGNYLVCHESQGRVDEYDSSGAVVWSFEVPMFGRQAAKGHGLDAFGNKCFAALRLKNGNTLISTGNGHSVIEVTPAKEIAWKLEQDELPGIRLAWVTTLQELPDGNLVIGNCHAGPANPQLIEITREKKVVWTFQDFENFGNATTNSQILTTNGMQVDVTAGTNR